MSSSSSWSIDAQGRLVSTPESNASVAADRARSGSLDRIQWAEDLAELIAAGLSIRESLQILAERPGRTSEQRLLASLRLQIEQGATLSQAMARRIDVFGDALVALVGASEMTSNLPEGLRRFAQVSRRVQTLRTHIVSALVYPALLTFTGLAVLVFLLGFVVPRFAQVVQQNAQALSGPSGWLLGMGQWLGQTRTVWMTAVLSIPVVLLLFLRSPHGRLALQRVLLRLPRIGMALRDLHRARFFASMATLTLGGVPVLQALTLSATLLLETESVRLTQGIAAIRRGDPVAQALSGRPFDDSVILRLLEVAQRTASLPTTFERLAHLIETRVSRDIDRLMRLFEPVMMLGARRAHRHRGRSHVRAHPRTRDRSAVISP